MLSSAVGFDKVTGRPARRPRRPSESADASSSQPCGGPEVVGRRAVAIMLFAGASKTADKLRQQGMLMFRRFALARPLAAAALCVAFAAGTGTSPAFADPTPKDVLKIYADIAQTPSSPSRPRTIFAARVRHGSPRAFRTCRPRLSASATPSSTIGRAG